MIDNSLFHSRNILCDLNVSSKKQLFQEMVSVLLTSPELDSANLTCRDIVNAAVERERLGSTGVGSGVALPHARIDGIDRVHAVFARLEVPLDYEAIDDRPVDLVTLLLAPTDAGGAHLRALAKVSRLLRRQDLRQRLRTAPNAESLFVTLTDERKATAA